MNGRNVLNDEWGDVNCEWSMVNGGRGWKVERGIWNGRRGMIDVR